MSLEKISDVLLLKAWIKATRLEGVEIEFLSYLETEILKRKLLSLKELRYNNEK
jgi:hypothetical protein